jgi:hypothetical protein
MYYSGFRCRGNVLPNRCLTIVIFFTIASNGRWGITNLKGRGRTLLWPNPGIWVQVLRKTTNLSILGVLVEIGEVLPFELSIMLWRRTSRYKAHYLIIKPWYFSSKRRFNEKNIYIFILNGVRCLTFQQCDEEKHSSRKHLVTGSNIASHLYSTIHPLSSHMTSSYWLLKEQYLSPVILTKWLAPLPLMREVLSQNFGRDISWTQENAWTVFHSLLSYSLPLTVDRYLVFGLIHTASLTTRSVFIRVILTCSKLCVSALPNTSITTCHETVAHACTITLQNMFL